MWSISNVYYMDITTDLLDGIQSKIKLSNILGNHHGIKPTSTTHLIVVDNYMHERFKMFSQNELSKISLTSCHLINTPNTVKNVIFNTIIFFISPLVDNIRLINQYLSSIEKPKNSYSIHIIMTSIYLPMSVTDQINNLISNNDNIFYHQLPLCMFNYDENVIVLDNNYYEVMMDYLSDTEHLIEYVMNKFNIKNDYVLAAGKYSLSLMFKLENSLIHHDDNNNNFTHTILVDREYDLISLLKLQTTYGGMTNEIIGLQAMHKEIKISNDNKNITSVNKGIIYKMIQYMNIQDAHQEIKNILKEIDVKVNEINEKIKITLQNITNEDKQFIKSIYRNKRECSELLTLLSYLIDMQQTQNYINKIYLQELVINKYGLGINFINKLVDTVTNFDDLISCIRYTIFYSQYNNGLIEQEYLELLNSKIKNKYEEWPLILRYLKQHDIIKVKNVKKYVMNFVKQMVINKNTEFGLFNEIVESVSIGKGCNEIMKLISTYKESAQCQVMSANAKLTDIQCNNIIMIIIGGVTVDEISAMKHAAIKNKKKLIIITTGIVTSNSYINNIINTTTIVS